VAYDFLFTGTTPGDAACEAAFERHADRLVVTSRITESDAAMGGSQEITYPQDELIPEKGPEIVGVANFLSDPDGVERSLIHGYNSLLLAQPSLAADTQQAAALKPDIFSFSWLAAEKALGHPPARDPETPMFVNFYGPVGTIKTILLDEVLLNWGTTYKHGEYFRDKAVFVGPISETRFKDDHDTPMGMMHGVEIQATAYANLVHGNWLRPPPNWLAPVLACAFGLVSLLICLRAHAVLARVALLVGLAGLYIMVTQWLFAEHQFMVPVTCALVGIVGCGGFCTVFDYVLERYERRRMLGVFESMVSPGVANLVLGHRDDFEKRLGGQHQKVVVLFSDIRGFTTWSEKVGPVALVTQLNEYFFEMVGIIQEEGGTVQKYIGDALMAAWGDVRDQPADECANGSVRAALRMAEALKKLNAGWVGQPGREQLSFGIGINYGDGVVGRIGHPRRQEFTVMGDTVNLAARFESATKQYHQTILVGQQIYELTKEQFLYRLADKMQVMGKTFAVPVYVPMGLRTAPPPPGLAEYEAAIGKYYARDFSGAAELFRAARDKLDGDFLSDSFLERCRTYLAEPPPPDWDGAWVLKAK
jgi:adenylate cyclase